MPEHRERRKTEGHLKGYARVQVQLAKSRKGESPQKQQPKFFNKYIFKTVIRGVLGIKGISASSHDIHMYYNVHVVLYFLNILARIPGINFHESFIWKMS